MQITSAMKMVSAAKLKKAQDAITAMRPYADKLTELLQSLSASLDGDSGSKYSDNREINKVLIVAITSNRGLAGAFRFPQNPSRLAAGAFLLFRLPVTVVGTKVPNRLAPSIRVMVNAPKF